jgi:hypothetical protein
MNDTYNRLRSNWGLVHFELPGPLTAVLLSHYIDTVCTFDQAKVPLYEGDIPPIGRPDRYEELTWEPGRTHDHNLLMYLRAARYGVSYQCFGSGFNQVSGFVSGLGIRIRIQEGKSDPQK